MDSIACAAIDQAESLLYKAVMQSGCLNKPYKELTPAEERLLVCWEALTDAADFLAICADYQYLDSKKGGFNMLDLIKEVLQSTPWWRLLLEFICWIVTAVIFAALCYILLVVF